jgi:hypothetical protein
MEIYGTTATLQTQAGDGMKKYCVTCRGVKETFIVQVKATNYGHEFGHDHDLLSFYNGDKKVAVFKEWICFEVIE